MAQPGYNRPRTQPDKNDSAKQPGFNPLLHQKKISEESSIGYYLLVKGDTLAEIDEYYTESTNELFHRRPLPMMAKVGFPLMVARAIESPQTGFKRAAYLTMDYNTGKIPEDWLNYKGEYYIARADKEPLPKDYFRIMRECCAQISKELQENKKPVISMKTYLEFFGVWTWRESEFGTPSK